jgi:hypothetical protein
VRTFRLKGNKTGEVIDLSGSVYFLSAPKNLGIKIKKQYIHLFGRRIPTEAENEYLPFSGDINIMGNAYANYEALRAFVAKNKAAGFKLYYAPTGAAERYMVCDVEQLEKSELESTGLLISGITLQPRSLWLVDVTVNAEFESNEDSGKIYFDLGGGEYAYSYADIGGGEYAYTYSDSAAGEANLINSGDEETSLKITVDGPLLNPYFQIFDVNGNVVQTAKINETITSGEKLIIDSDPEGLKVVHVTTAGAEVDWRDNQDYTMTTYLTLPVGEYVLRITHDNADPIAGKVEYSMQHIGG